MPIQSEIRSRCPRVRNFSVVQGLSQRGGRLLIPTLGSSRKCHCKRF